MPKNTPENSNNHTQIKSGEWAIKSILLATLALFASIWVILSPQQERDANHEVSIISENPPSEFYNFCRKIINEVYPTYNDAATDANQRYIRRFIGERNITDNFDIIPIYACPWPTLDDNIIYSINSLIEPKDVAFIHPALSLIRKISEHYIEPDPSWIWRAAITLVDRI